MISMVDGCANAVAALRRESFFLERSGKALGKTNHWSHTLKGTGIVPGRRRA